MICIWFLCIKSINISEEENKSHKEKQVHIKLNKKFSTIKCQL